MTRIGCLALALTGSIIFTTGLLSVPVAQATTCGLNVTGRWAIMQSNNTEVRLYLTQSGSVVRGKAWAMGSGWGTVRGTVSGNQLGTLLNFQIFWQGGQSVGDYHGSIADHGGYAEGHTFDIAARSYAVDHTQPVTHWRSTSPLKCL